MYLIYFNILSIRKLEGVERKFRQNCTSTVLYKMTTSGTWFILVHA